MCVVFHPHTAPFQWRKCISLSFLLGGRGAGGDQPSELDIQTEHLSASLIFPLHVQLAFSLYNHIFIQRQGLKFINPDILWIPGDFLSWN